jgi:hypothetical protein
MPTDGSPPSILCSVGTETLSLRAQDRRDSPRRSRAMRRFSPNALRASKAPSGMVFEANDAFDMSYICTNTPFCQYIWINPADGQALRVPYGWPPFPPREFGDSHSGPAGCRRRCYRRPRLKASLITRSRRCGRPWPSRPGWQERFAFPVLGLLVEHG